MTHKTIDRLGLIIIGDEILNGRRQDSHFTSTMALCHEWNIALAYTLVLPDDPEVLVAHFRWAMAQPYPFISCGGIGSTPDDVTRQSAARAAGVEVEPHAEAVRILKDRFGDLINEPRLRMVSFPQTADLVPNPVNQVPGFHIANGYFLPGFPSMAAPMMRWIMQTYYAVGPERLRCGMVLPNAREADLTDLMEAFVADYPDVTFSSLPQHTDRGPQVTLSISAVTARAEAAYADLKQRLAAVPVPFEEQ
ncbi:MAG: competence/damage-inducible protein A [Lentisphaerae bacterium]|nr:competence/damage-inducible protein A [Lentisphaerota bacterium]